MDQLPWLNAIVFSGEARDNQSAMFLCGEHKRALDCEYTSTGRPRRVSVEYGHLAKSLIARRNKHPRRDCGRLKAVSGKRDDRGHTTRVDTIAHRNGAL